MGKTEQSITIAAPPNRVWKAIRNFHDMSWAPNVILECKPVGDVQGDRPGARRVLNNAFHETMIEINDIERTVKYSIDEGPPAVFNDKVDQYVGALKVTDDNEGSSRVDWDSSWVGNDEETAELCHPIYVALLEDMKKSLE